MYHTYIKTRRDTHTRKVMTMITILMKGLPRTVKYRQGVCLT